MKRWNPTIDGEQMITLTFNVAYSAEGKCYSDPGKINPVDDSYPPEGAAEITTLKAIVTDEAGNVLPELSETWLKVMAAFDREQVEDELFQTEASDYLEDRRDYERGR